VYEGTQIDGAYHTVNDRLRGLVAEGVLAEPAFERSVVDVRARRMEPPPPPLPLPRLEGPGGGVTVTEALHRRLRRTHRGWDVTSYTRMKAARRARVEEAALEELEADRFRADQVDLGGLEETLPGGAATGILLHELLEHLDEDAVRAAATVDALPAEAMELAEARCRAHGVELRWAPTCLALAHRALTRPLPLPDGRALPDGLRSAERSVRELSYLHPLPEPDGQVDRGFVRGVIDLVFEQEGRVYVVDYKSDRLPSYDPETLAAHVETHYEVQARLYTLGVVRAFRLGREADYEARFGGLLYLFLRAEGDDGVYLARPSYDEVDGWERALRDDAEPWGYPLPPRRSA
jgi:exodeoxyribonuclease V beta subunit